MHTFSPPGRLIIICGLPGSGKTTLAKSLEQEFGAVRFSADEWMEGLGVNLHDEQFRALTETLQWQVGQRLLSLGLVVVIEWGTWGRSERDALRMKARSLGAAVELRYLTASADELFDRIRRRGMENPPIEWTTVLRWFEVFQAPTPEELGLFDAPSDVQSRQC